MKLIGATVVIVAISVAIIAGYYVYAISTNGGSTHFFMTTTGSSSSTSTSTITIKAINISKIPINNPVFIGSSSTYNAISGAGCTLTNSTGTYAIPCIVPNIQNAQIFTCANPTNGCTQQDLSQQVTFWYPYLGHPNETSWANCVYAYNSRAIINPHLCNQGSLCRNASYGYCLAINSTAFVIVTGQAPLAQ